MKFIKNEKGQALVMVLFFSLIASLMILAVLYLVIRGTAVSGMQKRFQTSLDAAYAGVSAQTRYVKQGSYSMNDPMFSGSTVSLSAGAPGTCTYQKLFFAYGASGALWSSCTAASLTIDAEADPEFQYAVNGQNTTYTVSQKIVDTRRGLTAQRPPGVELPTGVAYGGDTGIALTQQAYVYYAVEVKARDSKKGEIARISFDYAW